MHVYVRTRMRTHASPSTPRTGRRARRAGGRRPRRSASLPAAAARRMLRRWRDRAVGRAGRGGRGNLHQGAWYRGQPGGGGRRSSQRGGQRVGRGSVLGGARPRRGPHRNARAAAAPLVHQKGRRRPQHLCREGGQKATGPLCSGCGAAVSPWLRPGRGCWHPLARWHEAGALPPAYNPLPPVQPPPPSCYIADLERSRLQDVAARDGGAVRGAAAVAVLDPPRTGLSPSVCRALRASDAVGGIVFVSCNPHGHTLRRDFVLRGGNLAANARILCARGSTPPFRLCAAVPVDVRRLHPNPRPAPIGSKAHPPLPRTCASASSSGTRHIASWCSPSNAAWSAARRRSGRNNRSLRRGAPLFVIELENDRAHGFSRWFRE